MMKKLTPSSTASFPASLSFTDVFKIVSAAVSESLFFSSDVSFTPSLQLFS